MTEPPDEEVARLRALVGSLEDRLDTRSRRAAQRLWVRRATAAVAVMLAAFCAVSGVVGVWVANTTFNTDRWVRTVTPLPKNDQVAAAVAEYGSTEVFALLDVEDRLRTALPDRVAFAAGPIAGQMRNYVRQTVQAVLHSDRFQAVWVELNRRAHQRLIAVLNGQSDVVTAGERRVSIDLLPLVNQVLRALEASLPSLFGHRLNLPDLSSGAIPDSLRTTVEEQLGVVLPANFAQFTIYDAGRLHALQVAVIRFKRSLVALGLGLVALFALALWVSPGRRRTVLQFGVWLAVGTLIMSVSLRSVRRELLAQVPEGTYRDGVAAAFTTVFAGLRERGDQLLWLGFLLALAGYLAGPGRVPVWLRSQVRRAGAGLVDLTRRAGHSGAARRGLDWVGRHVDALRIGGVVLAGLFSLLLSTWTGLLVMGVLLVAYEMVLTLLRPRAHG